MKLRTLSGVIVKLHVPRTSRSPSETPDTLYYQRKPPRTPWPQSENPHAPWSSLYVPPQFDIRWGFQSNSSQKYHLCRPALPCLTDLGSRPYLYSPRQDGNVACCLMWPECQELSSVASEQLSNNIVFVHALSFEFHDVMSLRFETRNKELETHGIEIETEWADRVYFCLSRP
jgi:hypothetical protein